MTDFRADTLLDAALMAAATRGEFEAEAEVHGITAQYAYERMMWLSEQPAIYLLDVLAAVPVDEVEEVLSRIIEWK